MNYVDSEKSILLNQWEILCLKYYQKEMINSTIPNTEIIHHEEWLVEYKVRTETFRQCLQVFVGNIWKEKHIKFLKNLWIAEPEYYLNWFYTYEISNTNVIRLRSYNLSTLIHELVHFVAHQCEIIGCDFTEEIPAYIMEEIITKLMIISKGKFKVEKGFY